MTIVGYGGGFVWADSEGYIGGKPVPEPLQKLVVSPGNLIGIGHGYKTLLDAFKSLLVGLGHASFATAIRTLPPLLRRALDEDCAARSEPYAMSTVFAVCGRDGGAVFDPRHGYEPRMRESWASPQVGRGAPESAADVLTIAQAQIRVIIDEVGSSATGGQLTVAKIGADRVVKTIVPLLIGDERTPRRDRRLGNATKTPPLSDSLAHERARLVEIARLRECSP